MYFRVFIIIIVLSLISWFILKLINKPKHFAIVMLAWLFIVLAGGAMFYGISIIVAGLNNS